jgi:hypothetical protein
MTKGVKQSTIKRKLNVKYGYHAAPQSTLNAFLNLKEPLIATETES